MQFEFDLYSKQLAVLLLAPMVTVISSTALAEATTTPDAPSELDTIVVIGSGRSAVYDLAQPITALDKDAIDRNPGEASVHLVDDIGEFRELHEISLPIRDSKTSLLFIVRASPAAPTSSPSASRRAEFHGPRTRRA